MKKYRWLVILSIFLIFWQISFVQAQEGVPFENPIFPQMLENVDQLTIYDEAITRLQLDTETMTWDSEEEMPRLDQDNIWQIIVLLSQIEGEVVEENDVISASPISSTFEFITENGNTHHIALLDSEGEQDYLIYNYEQFVEVEALVPELKTFSTFDLFKPLSFDIGAVTEIGYANSEESWMLNTESDFTTVETAPFISGWFLHNEDLETEFSVEYQQMVALAENLNLLRAVEVEGEEADLIAELEPIFTLDIVGVDGTEHISAFLNDSNRVFLHVESTDEVYEIAQKTLDSFNLSMFEMIDNFIAIIPLDSVAKVIVDSDFITLEYVIEHEILEAENEEEGPQVAFDYFVDGTVVEEADVRKQYQYLASLSYSRIADLAEREIDGEATINVTYEFNSDGELHTKILAFYPLNETEYLVELDGVRELVADKESVDQALLELESLIVE